jgi:hypothetical protein
LLWPCSSNIFGCWVGYQLKPCVAKSSIRKCIFHRRGPPFHFCIARLIDVTILIVNGGLQRRMKWASLRRLAGTPPEIMFLRPEVSGGTSSNIQPVEVLTNGDKHTLRAGTEGQQLPPTMFGCLSTRAVVPHLSYLDIVVAVSMV